jgi:hypothetical protein
MNPYRSTALVVLPTHREVVRCGWCAWDRNGDWMCIGPPHGRGDVGELNRDGDCIYYRDSFATRILRRLGLRSPALVRVTDREHEVGDVSPRSGGSVDVWADRQREQSRILREGSVRRDPWTGASRPKVHEDPPPPAPKERIG